MKWIDVLIYDDFNFKIELNIFYILKLKMDQSGLSLNKMHQVVLDEMLSAAQIRCRIPNANNGRAYMGCIVLDRSCPL